MKIPKKISPDRIKQSVIEVKYVSNKEFEIAIGMFFGVLDDSYVYTNRPVRIKRNDRVIAVTFSDISPFRGRFLFFNDKIKIEIQQGSIIFNCLDEYISWEVYAPEINKVITQLLNANVIESFTRVGVRYISHYPDIDLNDCVKFSFTFGMPEIISKSYSFKTEFEIDSNKVVINLHNKFPIFDNKFENNLPVTTPVSIVDIDVSIEVSIGKGKINDLLDKITAVHQKEKELFFTLLKEQFLATLNPIY